MAQHDDSIADIAIIGSGIACSSTLIAIFEELLAGNYVVNTPLRITVIERYAELWKGIPYGNRSSVNALTITTLHDFFTDDKERSAFYDWFVPRQNEILNNYAKLGGSTATTWLNDNKEALEKQDWNNIYVPRFIIGDYTLQRLNKLRKQAEGKGLVKVTTIEGNAVAVWRHQDFKSVVVDRKKVEIFIKTKKIVLAIGSAPECKLTNAFDNQSQVLYINNLHAKNLEETVGEIQSYLTAAPLPDRNILILGTNASSIELLYLLNTKKELSTVVNNITLISSSGKLPGEITYMTYTHHVTANLENLAKRGNYNLEELVEAATKDILTVVEEAVSVPDVDKIMGLTISLLQPLDTNSKNLFYGIYGVQLARIFRRSGTDYKRASSTLNKNEKLTFLKGNFLGLQYNADGSTTLVYKQDDESTIQLKKTFKVVINCTGADDLQTTSSLLIKDLIQNNNCRVNQSQKALEVAENLEAAPDIFVIGPLAGGNFNKLLYFWHLENASRIIYLSKHLAKELLK